MLNLLAAVRIRLADLKGQNEGRIEVLYKNKWYGVCLYPGFKDAKLLFVVCRQLGYDAPVKVYSTYPWSGGTCNESPLFRPSLLSLFSFTKGRTISKVLGKGRWGMFCLYNFSSSPSGFQEMSF